MNFLFVKWQPAASSGGGFDDDNGSDWLGGEAWVTPQPFSHEPRGAANIAARSEDPAMDWTPL
ncbi:hypothetical protein [Dokdonella sp.]|uniref:hypothetical protein n=1 Tax=Dokdonella sp. TaxID=2291710 RepID=UPI002B8487A7|nr:hypothetical protein [Dokdonella sp.]HOX72762.1 hypothetical protein [Dokdonella sp.]HPN78855.1 hypothetical protein [Dokdonella sp.]